MTYGERRVVAATEALKTAVLRKRSAAELQRLADEVATALTFLIEERAAPPKPEAG